MTLGSINIIYEAVTAVPDNSTSCGGGGAHDSVSHELPLSPISHGLKSSTGTWLNETIGAWFFLFLFSLTQEMLTKLGHLSSDIRPEESWRSSGETQVRPL